MTTNKGEIEWKEFEKVLEDEGIDPIVITSEKVSFLNFQKTKQKNGKLNCKKQTTPLQ